jgi:hypothetical protein
MGNNMLKCYGHVLRMEDNRWPKRIMTWLPVGGMKKRQKKTRNEVERGMKQKRI